MKIAVGSDHAGYALKARLARQLEEEGYTVVDLGTDSEASVDYPEFAAAVGRAVAGGEAESGLLVCGTGIGVAMAAGKVPGVRAATCNDVFTAHMARAHNDANVLTLGSRVVGDGVAQAIIHTFFTTPFDGGRHLRRVEKINALD